MTSKWLPKWFNGKESAYQCRSCRRCGFNPWVGKIPWSRKWQPTPVFLSGKFHRHRSLVDYWACTHTHIHTHTPIHIQTHTHTCILTGVYMHIHTGKNLILFCFEHNCSSVQFSHALVSDSLWPHELQHARPPCPSSPALGVHSGSRPSSPWCHPAISSSVVPFSSCPQSLPASESFPVSQLFTWGGRSTGVSALASVLPKKSQGWSPSEWTGWISLQSKGLSRVFSTTTVQKQQFFGAQPSSQSSSHIHTWPQEKP